MLTGRGDPSLAIDLIVYVEVLDSFIGARPFHKIQVLEIHIAALDIYTKMNLFKRIF